MPRTIQQNIASSKQLLQKAAKQDRQKAGTIKASPKKGISK